MLIKRTEREARRGTLAAALASQSGGALGRTFMEIETEAFALPS